MKSSEKVKIAIIGGTGFEKLFKDGRSLRVKTIYGTVPPIFIGTADDRKVAFLPRHGADHSVPPHRINYKANLHALYKLGVEQIISTNAVGAINGDFQPGDLVIPHDFIDFTRSRPATFYDNAPVTHIDMSQPYCPEMRRLLTQTARGRKLQVRDKAVLVCTEGPRYETPAEIEMFRRLGSDIVGMTGCPEAVLAREREMCYATICYVSNMAAGMQQRLSALEVSKVSRKILPIIEEILIGTIKGLQFRREKHRPCSGALRNARFQ